MESRSKSKSNHKATSSSSSSHQPPKLDQQQQEQPPMNQNNSNNNFNNIWSNSGPDNNSFLPSSSLSLDYRSVAESYEELDSLSDISTEKSDGDAARPTALMNI